ncbi:MAG: signal peptidase I [candidate division Zixibacteria bacterium]|nr:signal peptidase I [candidate division Zixibacteria bacterium]
MNTIKTLLYALIMALLIKYSVIEAYNVPTGSMEDTILIGDFLLANKFIYGIRLPLIGVTLPGIRDPRPGDVVVFKWPGDRSTNYVKRCIAVGGQTVVIREKKVFVDGVEFKEYPNLKHTDRNILRSRDNFGPFRVPRDCYFMMGDNRDDSYDSRFWGPVEKELIMGKALVVHWSWGPAPDKDYPRWEWTDPLTWPASLWYNLIHFHERVRWNRLGAAVG